MRGKRLLAVAGGALCFALVPRPSSAGMGSVLPAHLASEYTAYRLKLATYHPSSSNPDGLVIPTRINGGRPLRLVLDTGARGIVIHAKAARGLGLNVIAESQLGGFGSSAAVAGQTAVARSISFGDLEFRDYPIQMSAAAIAPGADGVLGASLFRDFRIAVDPRALVMDLSPYAAGPDPGGIPVYNARDLLLVEATIDRERRGLFLVDTGSAYTSLSRAIGRRSADHSSSVALVGAQGAVAQACRTAPVELRIGGRTLVDANAVTVDLERISEQEGVAIAGVLGYSLLGKSRFILNYRDGIIHFGR